MRWTARKPAENKIGDTRIVLRFLFVPLTLGGETRWLERAWIKQEYDSQLGFVTGTSVSSAFAYWKDTDWETAQGYIRSIKWLNPPPRQRAQKHNP